MAVFASGLTNIEMGIALAIAIAAHNIPEGIAVAALYTTQLKVKLALLSGLFIGIAEPLGAVIMIILIGHHLSET